MRRSLLALFVCATTPALGADFYVDPVSGNDTTGNGSAASPWRTLQSVVDDRVQTRDWTRCPGTPLARSSP